VGVTAIEVIRKALDEAVYCERCDEEFTSEADKYPPSDVSVAWQGYADIICENCAEAQWEAANDRACEW